MLKGYRERSRWWSEEEKQLIELNFHRFAMSSREVKVDRSDPSVESRAVADADYHSCLSRAIEGNLELSATISEVLMNGAFPPQLSLSEVLHPSGIESSASSLVLWRPGFNTSAVSTNSVADEVGRDATMRDEMERREFPLVQTVLEVRGK